MNNRILLIVLLLVGLVAAGFLGYHYVLLKRPTSLPQKQMSERLPEISVVSDIDGVTANLSDEAWFRERLSEVNFWNVNNIVFFDSSGLQRGKISPLSLRVHLTDKPQPLGQTVYTEPDGKKYMYQSFGMSFDPEQRLLDLYLFVHPDILRSESKDNLSTRFSYLLLFTIFDITHPILPEQKSFEERLIGKDDYIAKLYEVDKKAFILVK